MRQLKKKSIKEKTNICKETPVKLTVNGREITTFMCTPRSLDELAVGFLYNQDIIEKEQEIMSLGACKELKSINVQIDKEISNNELSLKDVLASSCGKSIDEKKVNDLGEVDSNLDIKLNKLQELAYQMFNNTVIYKKTGGVHCAGISKNNEFMFLEEDVGRHNAVDKIIGKAVLKDKNLSESIILTSGRISSDMILKVANSNLPIVVSRSIPTDLALKIAKKANITVVGRILRNEPIIYCGSERIN